MNQTTARKLAANLLRKLPLFLALLGEGEVGAKDNGEKGTKKNPRRLPRAFFVAPLVGLEPDDPLTAFAHKVASDLTPFPLRGEGVLP